MHPNRLGEAFRKLALPRWMNRRPSLSWVRLNIVTEADQQGGFGEVAFEFVPEPTAVVSLTCLGAATVLRRARTRGPATNRLKLLVTLFLDHRSTAMTS